MKRIAIASLITLSLAACQPQGASNADKSEAGKAVTRLDTEKQRISYVVGLDVARNLEPIKGELDLAVVDAAIRHALAGQKPLLDEAAVKTTRAAFTQHLHRKREAESRAKATKNQRDSGEFLATNANKVGVQSTASGLQYQVLSAGNGARPMADDTVRVNYIGSRLDGSEFENTYAIDHPAEFPLGQVMPGLREALPLMPVGSKYRFWVPSRLAYGEHGVPGTIEPNAVLVFEVELLAIAGQATQ